MSIEIKVGQLVTLKSGGPLMTVVEIYPPECHCVWFDPKDLSGPKRDNFVIEALEIKE